MLKYLKQLLDCLYLQRCYFCKKSSANQIMCPSCYEKMDTNSTLPVKVIEGVEIFSAGLYDDNLKKLIRGLKYHKQRDLAAYLAKFMYNYMAELGLFEEDFEIIPMPLHKNRLKHRKYNHMDIVGEELALISGYSLNTELITRVKDTIPLYTLKRNERLKELKDAFCVNKEAYNNKKLLIIDDITTSGASLQEMINCLKANGISDIIGLVSANP